MPPQKRAQQNRHADAGDAGAPMTAGQRSRLKELAARAGDPDAYGETLTRGEARTRIAALEILLEREAHRGADRLPRT